MTYLDRIGARFNKIGTSWWWDYITGASGVGFCRDTGCVSDQGLGCNGCFGCFGRWAFGFHFCLNSYWARFSA